MESHSILHGLALLAILGTSAQWFAWRFHLPSIILLSFAGLIIGPGLGLFNPAEVLGSIMEPIIKLSVALILFEGGLNLHLHELKGTAKGVKRLASIGIILSWSGGTLAAHFIGGLSWQVSLIFGAIIVVTGPTVILPLLRQARLKRRPASFLKWEGIVNDPIGALLAVVVFEILISTGENASISFILSAFITSLTVASILGIGLGFFIAFAFRRGQVPEFLKPNVISALVLGIYVVANAFHEEAGLLATTLFGVVIGNAKLKSIDEIRRHNEYIAVFLVSSVFLLLTANLDPVLIQQISWREILLVFSIIFIVRPITVFLSTIQADMTWQERSLSAWIAPRGVVAAAVAGVFGAAMTQHGYVDANKLVPTIFLLILSTVILHGLTIGWFSRRLHLSSTQTQGVLIVGASAWSTALAHELVALKIPCLLADSSWSRLRAARLAGLPVYYGEIMSERSEESLELIEMNYLLAATSNDAYNALVCMRFSPEFGRHQVFQLPTAVDENEPKSVSHTSRGAIAFQEDALHEELLHLYFKGWRFQKTKITESYTYENYQQDAPEDRMLIMLIRNSKAILFATPKSQLIPKAGDLLLSFQCSENLKNSK